MKKTIITFALAIFSVCVFSQSFYTVDAQVVESSLTQYTHTVADTVVVDSTSMLINCWFGQVGNPYITGHNWTQFDQIGATVKGDGKQSSMINGAFKFADAYRIKNYPDIP